MERRRIDRRPVMHEGNRLIGFTTRRNLLRVFLRTDAEIRRKSSTPFMPGGRPPAVRWSSTSMSGTGSSPWPARPGRRSMRRY
ncbi:hypothetical protein ACFZCF_30005 [Streptomyces sp. NPDC007945]